MLGWIIVKIKCKINAFFGEGGVNLPQLKVSISVRKEFALVTDVAFTPIFLLRKVF